MKKAVFIDRDGVINNDEGHYYIYKPEDFKINEGIIEGLTLLQEHGFHIIVVTNQGGVAKGEYTEEDVKRVHDHFLDLMTIAGINITAIYYCPHHNKISDCDCRKPKPGMILKALKEHQIDVEYSFLIGDSPRDIEAGERAGLKQCFKIKANHSIIPACKNIIEQ
ncbi:D-glycero-alpha-D-manno-heptose-1,7-bisphosphate 7-phosphatase [Carboxylicivirga caseinilyticus]|uniref:D-glycero-alpha-D-manno-heptose-1,7-bisphosphate 7-phosphatase n=1 Tax=Carboxylicivirga caseinilyticus TaxID=3417572 RepID=UPI003D358CB1|nr:HAD family hydrolase [Marinilabiliaceae bacterium A049]